MCKNDVYEIDLKEEGKGASIEGKIQTIQKDIDALDEQKININQDLMTTKAKYNYYINLSISKKEIDSIIKIVDEKYKYKKRIPSFH